MTKTYQQLVKQIEVLKKQADQVRRKEVQGVVSRIKEAIAAYELTPEDLFGKSSRTSGAGAAASRRAPANGKARYQDDAGNTWSGRGPRPQWLKAALAEGRSLEDFAVGRRRGAAKPAARPARKKFKVAPKYRDEAGNTWSGRGSRPRWLQAALDSGKTLEDLAV